MEKKSWKSVTEYIEEQMIFNLDKRGKEGNENLALYKLLKRMSEVDPDIKVSETFTKHENNLEVK